MKFAGLWNVLAIRFSALPATTPTSFSLPLPTPPFPTCPPSSFRQTGNEGCARVSFPGILRMWRRPGMLGAPVVVVAVFSTSPYLSISSRFTDIPRSRDDSTRKQPVVCQNIELGRPSEWKDRVWRSRDVECEIGTLSARSL